MPANVTEQKVIQLNGGPNGRIRVVGTAEVSGGDFNFTINPGNNTVNISSPVDSKGLRNWDSIGVSCSSVQLPDTTWIDKIYDAGTDSWTAVVNPSLANQSFDWWIEGDNAGQ